MRRQWSAAEAGPNAHVARLLASTRTRRVKTRAVLCNGGKPLSLLRLADAVFGPPEGQPELRKRWWPRYLSVTALLAVVIVVRRLDAVTNPQFWAEDGYDYFVENATLGFLRSVARLYNDYPNLTQRFIALLGGLVPVAEAPRVYTSGAIVLTALALASFSLPAWRHLVRRDALRVLFCMAVVCLPFDRGVLSTPTNLGWFLAIWLSLVSVMRLPREPWRVAVLAAAGSCVVFSTPLAPINLPLWLLRGVRGSVRGDRRELSFALVLIAALAGVVLFTHGMGSTASVTILGMGAVRITFRSWANLASFRLATLVLPSTTPVVAGQPQMILTAHLPLAYLVASLVTVGLRASLAQPPPSTGDCRPLFGVPGGDARPRTRRGSRRPAARTRAKRIDARGDRASGAGWSPSFVSPPFQDLHWARYAPSIERTLRD